MIFLSQISPDEMSMIMSSKGDHDDNSNDDAKIMNIGDDDSGRDDKADAHNGEEGDTDGDEDDEDDVDEDDAHNG